MTYRAPSDRAQQILREIGLNVRALSALERDDALFILTADTLVYQDGGGTRRVTLRDLTRIHSDQDGLLRVETPAGTALTASLLGFDPAQVQGFFAQVRDATAAAKEQPASPLPQAAARTATPATPAAPAAASPAPVTRPEAPNTEAPSADAPSTGALSSGAPSSGAAQPAPRAPAAPEQSAAAPANAFPRVNPGVQTAPAPHTERPPTAPVVISSSGFSPNRVSADSRPAAPEPSSVKVAQAPSATPSPLHPSRVTPSPVTPVPMTQAPVAQAPLAPDTLAAAATPAPLVPGALAALARQADVVESLCGRLRVLGAVLFLGAVALAYVQFRTDALAALWTLLAGGVGTITLMSLSELARLLVTLARASTAQGDLNGE